MSYEEEIPIKTFKDSELVSTEIVKRLVTLNPEEEAMKDHEARLIYIEDFLSTVKELEARIRTLEDKLSKIGSKP